MKLNTLIASCSVWFIALIVTVSRPTSADTVRYTDDVRQAVTPLLESDSLVVSSLLLLIFILLISNIVWFKIALALYGDIKHNIQENHDMGVKNLKVLTDLDKTIQANTDARVRTGV